MLGKKYTILTIIIIFILSGMGVYLIFSQSFVKDMLVKQDPSCDGEKNPNFILGFGIEHYYEGDIDQGKHVKITLSCDHKKMNITGAVTQTIISSDVLKDDNVFAGLADLSSGEAVVEVSNDFNFDGYNDLSSIVNNGQGANAVKEYLIFIYNLSSDKFDFNKDISSLTNVNVDSENKEIFQEFCMPVNGSSKSECIKTRYKWVNQQLEEIFE